MAIRFEEVKTYEVKSEGGDAIGLIEFFGHAWHFAQEALTSDDEDRQIEAKLKELNEGG